MTLGLLLPVCLIDTDVIVWLDGINLEPNGVPRYTPLQQGLLWDGLEQLGRDGGLKLITQVRMELQDYDPAGLARLRAIPGVEAPRLSNAIRGRFQQIVAAHPGWVDQHTLRDPADPWLIAYAEQFGYTVLTEEKPQSAQRIRSRRPKIPDVCVARGVACVNLSDLATRLGWLSPP